MGAPLRRKPIATGEVQQVHIMLRSDKAAPMTPWPAALRRDMRCTNHRRRTSDSSTAATTSATRAAFQTAAAYALVKSRAPATLGADPGCPLVPKIAEPLQAPVADSVRVRSAYGSHFAHSRPATSSASTTRTPVTPTR